MPASRCFLFRCLNYKLGLYKQEKPKPFSKHKRKNKKLVYTIYEVIVLNKNKAIALFVKYIKYKLALCFIKKVLPQHSQQSTGIVFRCFREWILTYLILENCHLFSFLF